MNVRFATVAMIMACGMAPAAAFLPDGDVVTNGSRHHHHHHPVPSAPLNTSLGPFQHEVNAARDGGSLHLAWTEASWPGMETKPPPGGPMGAFINHTCGFSTSDDAGASWAPPTFRKRRGMIGANPVVGAGGGRVYRVCMGISDGTITPFRVAGVLEISVSADGGKTWSPFRAIFNDGHIPDKPWILVDGDDVFISFTHFNENVAEGMITVITSHDGGASFGAAVEVGTGQGSFITQAAEGGALFVSYVLGDYGAQVAQIAKSLDRGATFQVANGPKLYGLGFPTLTYLRAQVDGSMVLLANSAHYFGPAKLYSRPAGGGAWSRGITLSPWALNAGMSVGTGSAVDFVWTACTPNSGGTPGTGPMDPGYGPALNGTSQTFVASSTDGGVTITKYIPVSDPVPAHCGYPDVPGPLSGPNAGYWVYKGGYQGLVRDDLGELQVFYIKDTLPWNSSLWRAVVNKTKLE